MITITRVYLQSKKVAFVDYNLLIGRKPSKS